MLRTFLLFTINACGVSKHVMTGWTCPASICISSGENKPFCHICRILLSRITHPIFCRMCVQPVLYIHFLHQSRNFILFSTTYVVETQQRRLNIQVMMRTDYFFEFPNWAQSIFCMFRHLRPEVKLKLSNAV